MCLNINTGELALERRWPQEYWVELVKLILQEYKDFDIVFVGNENESRYIDIVLNKITVGSFKEEYVRLKNFAGKFNFLQLSEVLLRGKLFITADSGPLHLADMLAVPTISFFGPETPVLYGPESKNHFVFFKNIDCSPCINVHAGKLVKCVKKYPECMKSITVKEVWEKVREFLGISWSNE